MLVRGLKVDKIKDSLRKKNVNSGAANFERGLAKVRNRCSSAFPHAGADAHGDADAEACGGRGASISVHDFFSLILFMTDPFLLPSFPPRVAMVPGTISSPAFGCGAVFPVWEFLCYFPR